MEKKTEIRTDLLRKLADHLVNGQLGHKKFDFSVINGGPKDGKRGCGTLGCAMGELPVLFPEYWRFGGESILRLNYNGDTEDVCDFFGIGDEEYYHLFYPAAQNMYWGGHLDCSATKEEVAANIIKFCELAEKGLLDG